MINPWVEINQRRGRNMVRKTFQVVAFATLMLSAAFAQYGTISGTVVDRETGETLIGANVIIMGTSLGAATGLDGKFIIVNLPAGSYSVMVTYVGYQQLTVTNIRVVDGLTAYMEDLEMASEALETEPILVVAKRPLINKSATNVIRILTSEDMENMPVRGAQAYFTLQPGVVLQNNRVHIRGSRGDEVGYIIEGASTKNIYSRDGGNLINTIPEALEEVLVQAGGYAAEFGGANAGIVQMNFKTGSEKYHFSLQAETDNFGNYPGETFLDTYSYGYSDAVFTVSGPLLLKNIKFFLSGENHFTRDYAPMFWYGSPELWSDGDSMGVVYDSGLRGGSKSDSETLEWMPGNVDGRLRNRNTINGTIMFDFKRLLIRTAVAYSDQKSKNNSLPIMNLFALDRFSQTDATEIMVNTKVSYFLNPRSFIELNVNYVDDRSNWYDPHFKDDLLAYGDSLKVAQYAEENSLDWAHYMNYTSIPRDYDFYGFPFNRPGAPMSGYGKTQMMKNGASLAFTTQMKNHELKVGGERNNWTMRRFQYGSGGRGLRGLLSYFRLNPDKARNKDDLVNIIRQQASPNIYGFDEFGNLDDEGSDGPKHPQMMGFYLQDKVEYNDMIINAGVRYDYIYMDDFTHNDPTRPEFDRDEYTVTNIEKTKPHTFISPRLGFSFPVTDRTVFHMQYGKFVQTPGLDVAYRGLAYTAFVLTGGYYFTNPVAYGLEPVKTTQYEIGFTQQFTDFAAFDATAFYKDIKDQVQYDIVRAEAGWEISSYPVYSNQDFATTKGLEFQLRLRRVSRIMGMINYTLQSARGTNSFSQSAGGAIEGPGGGASKMTMPLQFEQTHKGSINLDYRFGRGEGGPILERFGLNLLMTFNSGHRYTLAKTPGGLGQEDASTGGILNDGDARQRAPVEPINSSTTPWFFKVDVRLDKTVTVAGLDLNIYTYVQNVFNRRNIINVYYSTGNASDDGFLTSRDGQQVVAGYGERFGDLYQTVNLQNRQHNFWLNGFDLYGLPRQIRFGVRLEL